MYRKKNKPAVLVLEANDPSQNIILSLDDLNKNNSDLREALRASNGQLDRLRQLLRKLG